MYTANVPGTRYYLPTQRCDSDTPGIPTYPMDISSVPGDRP